MAYRHALRPKLYTAGLANGTADSYTSLIQQTNILTAPYALTMFIEVAANYGFAGAANILEIDIRDEGLVTQIHYKSTNLNGPWVFNQSPAHRYGASLFGKKDYAVGATCGFGIYYKVTTSNTYIDLGIKVSFWPQ